MGQILYVDSKDHEHKLMQKILSTFYKDKYNLISKTDGISAYEYFLENQNTISLIITDTRLPKLNGYELLEKVKENDKYMPVVAYSGDAFPDQITKFLRLGGNDYLTKPMESLSHLKNLIDANIKKIDENVQKEKNLETIIGIKNLFKKSILAYDN